VHLQIDALPRLPPGRHRHARQIHLLAAQQQGQVVTAARLHQGLYDLAVTQVEIARLRHSQRQELALQVDRVGPTGQ